MAGDDKDKDEHEDIQHLRNQIAVLEAKLEHWQKFARTLCDLLRRVGSDRMSPEDARVRLQAAMEDRLVVAPAAERAAGAHDDRDRNRLIADAQRAVQRGNLSGAITMYGALTHDYPEDTRFRLKLGDCYARIGSLAKATETYLAVAAKYAEQGFFLKAVAVYKQILAMSGRQPPEQRPPRKVLAGVHHALGALYERLNFRDEALSQFEECYRLTDEGDAQLSTLGERIMRLGGNPQGLHD